MAAVDSQVTPYKRIYLGRAGKILRENPVLAPAAQGAILSAVYGAALRSRAFRGILGRAIGPAVGSGLVVLGVSMAHDGIISDLKRRPTKAGGKVLMGTALASGATYLIGKGLGIGVLANSSRSWSLVGAAGILSGAFMAYDGYKNDMPREGLLGIGKVAAGASISMLSVAAIRRAVATGSVLPNGGRIAIKYPALIGPVIATLGFAWAMSALVDGEEHKTREIAWVKRHFFSLLGGVATATAGTALAIQALPRGAALAAKLTSASGAAAGAAMVAGGLASLQEGVAQIRQGQLSPGIFRLAWSAPTVLAGVYLFGKGAGFRW